MENNIKVGIGVMILNEDKILLGHRAKNKRKYSIPKKTEGMEKYCRPTGVKKEKTFKLDKTYSGTWEMLYENEQDDDKTKFQYRYILINHKNIN